MKTNESQKSPGQDREKEIETIENSVYEIWTDLDATCDGVCEICDGGCIE